MTDIENGDKIFEQKPKIFFEDRRVVKGEIRIIGVDDSPFTFKSNHEVLILGTIHRGGGYLEGVVSSKVIVDGDDSTSKIIRMINQTKHKDQLQVIMLDGIAMGGFNVVDISELGNRTYLPVIVITRNKPNLRKVKSALMNVNNWEKKYELMKKAGKINEFRMASGAIYFQCYGVSPEKSKEIIKVSINKGHMPEPIRTAHILASGIVDGESRGRA